jgi:DHA2 family multidrug resistance protein
VSPPRDPQDPGGLELVSVDRPEHQQQASSMANFDVFWGAAVVGVALVLLVVLMRRSVAEKGANIAAE